ncbi:M10 family metallopeptidase C-terminal domain-containing protein [Alcaligenaceae bacterium]|nr:M10 family metallopeptidase C-terminal domain-containing protein [Alcaligenaceae bacterium]
MSLPTWTDQQVFNQMNSGSTWAAPVITYAFPLWASQFAPGLGDDTAGFSPINAIQQPLLNLGMLIWDDLISPTIQQGSAQSANILIGNTSSTDGYAFAYYPADGGSVWFSSKYHNLLKPEIGQDSFATFIHEIGHALGLRHMGDYNGENNNGPSSYQDSDMLSVMSYYGPGINYGQGQVAWGNWSNSDGHPYSVQTPMVNDIMVIQQMYGANPTTRVDNTVYGFGSNIQGQTAQIYDFSINQNPILTIYDAGGIDTLNLSGWSTNSVVDLRPGQYSSVNSMTNNIAIAHGVIIENLITGAGNDTLQGNWADNYLDGGAGHDTAIFIGNYADYSLSYDLFNREYTVQDTVGPNGTDTLINIESAIFSDFGDSLNNLTWGVHRFYNSDLGMHFYTANNDEASIVAQTEAFQYEGIGFGRSISGTDTVSVQRFLNTATGDHFYTANAAEADSIREPSGPWLYEGIAFNAYAHKTDDTTELFRFLNKGSGAHFYTADAAEMNTIMLSGNFNYEGIAFYVEA